MSNDNHFPELLKINCPSIKWALRGVLRYCRQFFDDLGGFRPIFAVKNVLEMKRVESWRVTGRDKLCRMENDVFRKKVLKPHSQKYGSLLGT